jgi:hypothetical protein
MEKLNMQPWGPIWGAAMGGARRGRGNSDGDYPSFGNKSRRMLVDKQP